MQIPFAIRRNSLSILITVTLSFALIGATNFVPFPEVVPLPDGFQPEEVG